MKANIFLRLFIIITVFCLSCHVKHQYSSLTNDRLNGYWIPEKIKWHPPNAGDTEEDKTTSVADYFILCIDSLGQCDLINSTQTKLNSSDSIGVEYEPGMELWKGKYKCSDSACNNLIVNFTPIPDENGRFYHGDKNVTDTIRVEHRQNNTYLYFRNKSYLKTTLYDSFSKRKIETFRCLKY